MANEVHLVILQHGVEVWNEWINKKIPRTVDISEALLEEVDLGFPDLSDADLQEMNLAGYDFRGTSFRRANLSKTELIKSDLRFANFEQANLSYAKLIGASFEDTNFEESNLQNADFSMAYIRFSCFRKANLRGTKFFKAILSGIDFIEATLDQTNFVDTNLGASNFTNASLIESDLRYAQAISCIFTGVKLTGAYIQDWNINASTRLDNIDCKYVYRKGFLTGERERFPLIDNFAPGEFTKLFQKSLETVDLIFRNGIDWDAFAYSFKKLEVENQGAQLDVQSIEKKGDGVILVRVAVAPDADKVKIHSDFMQGYEFAAKALEAQYQARLEDKDTLISKQEAQINRLFNIVEQQGSVQKALAENPRKVSNYNMQNPQFASGIVDANTVNSERIGGNIHNNDA
jgi:uncharacterized protein YjbI with pentapeptide repeats